VHYFDVTAEQTSALSAFEFFDAPARERGVAVVPAAGFYGGLGDVLSTCAMGDWAKAHRIDIAIALNNWWPTRGTRYTGQRNTAPRLVLSNGKLKPIQPSAPAPWNFPEPFGIQDVIELPFTETILISRHLHVRDVHNYMNQAPLRDLRNPATPEPVATDERGRSNQTFVIEAIVRSGHEERRAIVRGRDIYAITAPIVVEAVEGFFRRSSPVGGTFALAQLVKPALFLKTLTSETNR
jgi:hypothetical protein